MVALACATEGCGGSDSGLAVLVVGVYTAIGAGIGVGIDAMIVRTQTIEQSGTKPNFLVEDQDHARPRGWTQRHDAVSVVLTGAAVFEVTANRKNEDRNDGHSQSDILRKSTTWDSFQNKNYSSALNGKPNNSCSLSPSAVALATAASTCSVSVKLLWFFTPDLSPIENTPS